MYHFLVYRILGYFSVVAGLSATLCIFRIQNMFYAIMLAIMGFLSAGINIYLNQKYYRDQEEYPKGYWGTVLSSIPVLFLLFVIYRFKK
jgi:hypothetical protein